MLKLKLFFLTTISCCLLLAAPVRAQDAGSEGIDPDEQQAAAGDLDLTPDQIQQTQEMLKQLGYFFGPADGRKGPRTRTAIRNFQRDQGIEATGSLDRATVEHVEQAARMIRTEPTDVPAVSRSVPPERHRNVASGSKNVVKKTGGAIATGTKTATGATVSATTTGVKAGGKGTATAGKAIGTAGTTTARATTTAATTTAKASVVAAKTVVNSPMMAYRAGKRLLVGGDSSDDDKIQRAIERQYAVDDRLSPDEIEVRVVKGNVTLAFPEAPRSDVSHAVRLARLTPGVKSVTSVYVSTQVAPQNDPSVEEGSGGALTPEEEQITPP